MPCPQYHYAVCNTSHCEDCIQCEPGHACRGGVKYECNVGTYSDGYTGGNCLQLLFNSRVIILDNLF